MNNHSRYKREKPVRARIRASGAPRFSIRSRIRGAAAVVTAIVFLLPALRAEEIVLDDLETVTISGASKPGNWGPIAEVTSSTEVFSQGKQSLRYESPVANDSNAYLGFGRTVMEDWNRYTRLRLRVKCPDPNHGTMFVQLIAYKKDTEYAGVLTHVLLRAQEATMGWKEIDWDISEFDMTQMHRLAFYSYDRKGGAFKWQPGQKLIVFIDDIRLITPDIAVELEDEQEIGITGADFPASAVIAANSIRIGKAPATHEEIMVDEDGSFVSAVMVDEPLAKSEFDIEIRDSSHAGTGAYVFPVTLK